MQLLKIFDEEYNGSFVECGKLEEDILIKKYAVEENSNILLKEDEIGVLCENGNILDLIENPGKYRVSEGDSMVVDFFEDWKKLEIPKTEKEPLSILFISRKVIRHNKYFVTDPMEYKEYGQDESKEYYITFNGSYDFYIQDPKIFLSRVIGLRNHFPKQELIEQIRKHILLSIVQGMKELSEDYKLSLEEVQEKSKELEINLERNSADQKLMEYGIKLTYFDIDNLEIVDKKKKSKFF